MQQTDLEHANADGDHLAVRQAAERRAVELEARLDQAVSTHADLTAQLSASQRQLAEERAISATLRLDAADADHERADALRLAQHTVTELTEVRAMWAHTQQRLDREIELRAHDRRARQAAESERDALSAMQAALSAECAALRTERDAISGELAATHRTLSWRVTRPLRQARRLRRR